jgi:hypothetical protein
MKSKSREENEGLMKNALFPPKNAFHMKPSYLLILIVLSKMPPLRFTLRKEKSYYPSRLHYPFRHSEYQPTKCESNPSSSPLHLFVKKYQVSVAHVNVRNLIL